MTSLETGGSLSLPISLSLSLGDSGDSGMETAKTLTRTEARDKGDRPPSGPAVHCSIEPSQQPHDTDVIPLCAGNKTEAP